MTLKPTDSEEELLRKTAGGDHRAFRVIYDRYAAQIHGFAFRILQDEMMAEEVMQETMLKLWKMGPELIRIDHLKAYLRKASQNYCYNILRRQQLERRVQDELAGDWEEAHDDTEELILLNEARQRLQEAVDTLPAYYQRVYQLCHQEGLKYAEAAERLDISPNTVQTYMKHVLRTIRKYLRDNGDMAVLMIIFKLL